MEIAGWPPRWLTPIPAADLARGDGDHCCEVIEAFCRVTKDSVGGRVGEKIRLRPWQRQIPRYLLARRPDGRYRNRQALVGVARKNAKALDVATPMLTVDGWSTMGELRVGDEVFHPDGSLQRVSAVTGVMVEHDCYSVAFSDGRSIVADAGHLWTVRDRFLRREVTITTEEMRGRLRGGNRSTHREHRLSVTAPEPLKLADVNLPIDPYLLGVWLGDGTPATGGITSADPEIPAAFEAAGYGVRFTGKYRYVIYGLQEQLRQVGVLGNKHIPERYMTSGLTQRLALLQGLMDTDGTVALSGKMSSRRCSFTSVKYELANAALWLARSLGWKATIREGRAILRGKDCGPVWYVAFTAYSDQAPFRLARKQRLLPERPDRAARSTTIQIVSVEPVASRPVRCIEVERSDGLYLAGRDLVPTHNSTLGSGIAIYSLVYGPEGSEVYSCAGDRDQARIVFGTAKRMIEMDPDLSSLCKLYRDAVAIPSLGSVYRVLSAEAYSKEGMNPTTVLFDEVHVQPNRELWDVMALAMGARLEPLMVGITTAGVRYDTNGNDSLCYSLYEYGKRVCLGEVEDPSFFMAWWEPKLAGADYRDPATWREANPGYDDIVAAEDFAASVLRTPEQEFRTKRINQWVTSKIAWLPAGAWDSLESGGIPDGEQVVLGFDGSFNGDCTCIVAVSIAEVPHIEVVEVWERPEERGDDWQVPILDVEDAIRNACRTWQVREIACDPYRWARSFQVLESEGLPVVEFPQSSSRMTPATTRFYEAVVNKSITRSNDLRLARHIANAYLRADSRGTRIYKEHKHSTRRIDLAVAAVMALERAAWWHSYVPESTPFFAAWR